MSNNSKILLGIAPRRFGKSVAIAMLMAAGALVVPYLTEAVFATSQRISGSMGEYIRDAINMSGNGHRILKFGEEVILLSGDSPDDQRKISCFPANPRISDVVFFRFRFSLFFFPSLPPPPPPLHNRVVLTKHPHIHAKKKKKKMTRD